MISVIVPVYNTAEYLSMVVEALLGQDYPRANCEFIFVDNGSTDDSLAILQEFSEIKVLSEPQGGSYAARNTGIRHARGNILAFTDSDCYPAPDWLQSIDDQLASCEARAIMGPRLPEPDRRVLRLIADYENSKTRMILSSNDPRVYFGFTNNMAVRREAMENFGPFVLRDRGSDVLFIRRLVDGLSTDAVIYCPEMSVRHAEFNSVTAWLRKVNTYGKSFTNYENQAGARPVSMTERWEAFRRVARTISLSDSIILFAVLCLGATAWTIGRFWPS
jgi:glycosyltransferase involved in cell wall biosynthesis